MKNSIVLLGVLALIVGVAVWRLSRSPAVTTSITVARCVGYCNLPLFLASEQSRQPESKLRIDLRYIANPGDHAGALVTAGGPIASVTPFTNVVAANGNGKPVRIIAGSGMNGLAIVSRPEIKKFEQLAGGTLGTFRADTLETLAVDALEQNHLQGKVELTYFTDGFEPLTALRNGKLSAITHVEPFVSDLVTKDAMNVLTRGEQLWDGDHPDCVLTTTVDAIRAHRKELKILILEMARAQLRAEQDLAGVAAQVAKPFYDMEPAQLMLAIRSQFPAVDIRGKAQFIIDKSAVLQHLGYISEPANADLFDFSLLEEVINENPDLFGKLKHRYPTQ